MWCYGSEASAGNGPCAHSRGGRHDRSSPAGHADRRRDHRRRRQVDRRSHLRARSTKHGSTTTSWWCAARRSQIEISCTTAGASDRVEPHPSKSTRHPGLSRDHHARRQQVRPDGQLDMAIYRRGAEGWHTDGAYDACHSRRPSSTRSRSRAAAGTRSSPACTRHTMRCPTRLKRRLDGLRRRLRLRRAARKRRRC